MFVQQINSIKDQRHKKTGTFRISVHVTVVMKDGTDLTIRFACIWWFSDISTSSFIHHHICHLNSFISLCQIQEFHVQKRNWELENEVAVQYLHIKTTELLCKNILKEVK